ncbi:MULTISPECIES: helix-turn-helix domain-containing protein [unclassified Pseudomonas]|uniref:winged helix-turn-helix transcriptional regulator n=1 Tax=unclassified Pseudomonas TaxID=196821 RepID=UPI002AC992BC|nr:MULTISPECIES: helix-turn-helix domain-containing protein [unclassified Pseudomonas]MEB0042998.1 helix-turn-helix domain-containing protein [Pseudomonas sp. MH10]MEB0080275.1 helix-turn-helix domain-containing protein [Pseudomonas sp. MH10out]MEB0094162.1 helix-turn-helix domain-containing protein [Pseudomonas sp. CCI4.2]MEB0103371.1 helix-turn-helix domain-containing protein [Pseudomonas sp. CCI3.2]MEB0123293.1 helix-turn-helix domain-containing protein [Pseudomonas sp. CCI1.2]
MKRKSFESMHCPIARSLEHVGEWWNILILRDAYYGLSRFDEFQKSLGITPTTLTRRLNDLVDGGLLERRLYSEKPPRYDYVLTPRGRDFRPVLLTLMEWGNNHFSPEGKSIYLADETSGEAVNLALIDANTGKKINREEHAVRAGEAASEKVYERLEKGRVRRLAQRQQPSIPASNG